LVFVGDYVFVEECTTLHWLDWSKRVVERHDQYHHVSSAIVAIVALACWQCRPLELFAEFVFWISLHSGVSVGNRIGHEIAKALGGALKDNTTLTSLSLNLGCE
jgi:hypothetical protein